MVFEHNSLECGLGEVGTRDDDPNDKQPNQKISLELKDHLESITYEDVIDVIDKAFFYCRATTVEFPT